MKILILFLAIGLTPLAAEDWTVAGVTYKNVMVVKVQADAVTIIHDQGGGLIPLASLSPELQFKFHYDPEKAKAAAQQRRLDEAASAQALAGEMNQTAQQKNAKLIAYTAPVAAAPDVVKATAAADVAANNAIIQRRIDFLTDDIRFMQQEEAKLHYHRVLVADQATVTNGAYADKIRDEQVELAQLCGQLRGQLK